MFLVGILKNVIVGVLSSYIALTNIAADGISTVITGAPQEPERVVVAHSEPVTEELAFEELPSKYEYGGDIPRVLIDNPGFQGATVGESVILEEAAEENHTGAGRIEESLVNVFCQFRIGNYLRTTTGTGFFISRAGVVLTNAHVAQFLLLQDTESIDDAGCVLRAGSPAVPLYTAELLYIPPTWVNDYADQVVAEHPRGTGERDYALLYVADTLDASATPARFTYLPIDTALLPRSTSGITAQAAGYPAETLYTEGSETELVPEIASTTIGELYTFGTNYADVMTLSSSSVGMQGSSGGPVVQSDGSAIGLIVTKGDEENDGAQSLRALTLSYVDRTIKEETGFSLQENTSGDLAYRSYVFRQALVPFLSKILGREFLEVSTETSENS